MRWWQLPGGCFSLSVCADYPLGLCTKRLPALEEILPGILTRQNLFVITQIEFRRIERRLHFAPVERHRKWSFLAPPYRIGRHHCAAKRIAQRVQINAA